MKFKKIKVFFMGQRLCDIYPHATRWQVFKYKVRNATRKTMIFMMFCALLGVTFKIGAFVSPRTILAENQVQQIQVDSLPGKIEALKDNVVSKLSDCERAGHTEEDGIIIYDDNSAGTLGKQIPSIGVLQFKKSTVQHYYKTLYSKDITAKEAVMIALDKEQSFKLAKDIIFTTDKGLSNWLNCANKLQLRSEVDIINKLSK